MPLSVACLPVVAVLEPGAAAGPGWFPGRVVGTAPNAAYFPDVDVPEPGVPGG